MIYRFRHSAVIICVLVAVASLLTPLAGHAGVAGVLDSTTEVPITTKANFAVIMDFDSGDVLYAKRARTPTAPASMSKLMTAAIVFDMLKRGELALGDEFRVSKKAWSWQGSKMWVLVDTDISVENLLRGLIIQSGNDAAIVLAENIAGSEEAFAVLMNQKARDWGLVDSTFANATGWPNPGQRMSMLDLANLARKIIRDYPEYYGLFNEKEFTWSKITQSNRNPLLQAFEGADGLKTGHTDEAGYGVVGSAIQEGKRRIIVINGLSSAGDRLREARRMMAKAFNEFEERTYFRPNVPVAAADVFKGRQRSVDLVLKESVSMMVHQKLVDKVRAKVVYQGPVSAPILDGQQIGYLRVSVPGQEVRDYPLFAHEAIDEIGMLGKIGLAAQRLLLKPAEKDEVSTSSDLRDIREPLSQRNTRTGELSGKSAL